MENFSLVENQKRRALAVEKYREFIDKLIEPIDGKPPAGIKFRKWARGKLVLGASKIFNNEEEEYEYVCKPGRGVWDLDQLHLTSGNDIITMHNLAMAYGAYDY
jgi:hypothetical protein